MQKADEGMRAAEQSEVSAATMEPKQAKDPNRQRCYGLLFAFLGVLIGSPTSLFLRYEPISLLGRFASILVHAR
eukprot:scaffold7629_cov36-Tisochrysis_lutea.AAC.4